MSGEEANLRSLIAQLEAQQEVTRERAENAERDLRAATTRIEEAKAEGAAEERSRFVAAHEAAAESAPECPAEVIAGWLARELADFQMVINHCTEVYVHVTRDRISKPHTLPGEVIALHDDFLTEECEEARDEGFQEAIATAAAAMCHLCELGTPVEPNPEDRSLRTWWHPRARGPVVLCVAGRILGVAEARKE